MGYKINGNDYSPQSIEFNEDTNEYTFAGKTWKSQDWLFTDSIMADIEREEAEGEQYINMLASDTETYTNRLIEGFSMMDENATLLAEDRLDQSNEDELYVIGR